MYSLFVADDVVQLQVGQFSHRVGDTFSASLVYLHSSHEIRSVVKLTDPTPSQTKAVFYIHSSPAIFDFFLS